MGGRWMGPGVSQVELKAPVDVELSRLARRHHLFGMME